MKLRTKLIVGFGTLIAVLLVLTFVGYRLVSELNVTMNRIVADQYAGARLVMSIRAEINDMSRKTNELLLIREPESIQSQLEKIRNNQARIHDFWIEMNKLNSLPADTLYINQISQYYTRIVADVEQIAVYVQSGKRQEATDYYYANMEKVRELLYNTIRDFNSQYSQHIEDSLKQAQSDYRLTLLLLGGSVVPLLLFSIAVAYWAFRSVTRTLRKVASGMQHISFRDDSSLPRIPAGPKDEVGRIVEAYNEMADALEDYKRDAMQYQTLLRDQAWQRTKVAEISASFQGVQDVRKLSELYLSQVAPITGAAFGVLFGYASTEDEDGPLFKLAAYADQKGDLEESVDPGEGLIGQCVKDNKRILLTSLSEEHIRIRSGLGESKPAQLIVIPVPFEGRAIAAIELAAPVTFDEEKLAVAEEAAELLGIAIHSALSYMRIGQLLGESQLFTEELQAQSEELQLQQEELRTLNEQLEEQYKQSDLRNKELEKVKLELENKNRLVLQSSQYKSEFMANVSHELRTPLNSLLLLSQLLQDNKEGNLLPKQIDYLKSIRSSGNDLLKQINEILDLSKIESGKVDLITEAVSVGKLADFAWNQFSPFAHEKGLDLRIDLPAELQSAAIYTDGQKLQQIVNNLLMNAIKFTERGSVTISFAVTEAMRHGERPELLVSVADTGIGIPQDKQEMIFEPFRQADGTTSRKYGGTGLGLSISKELAALLGGVIWMRSEEGKGSIFNLRIPSLPSETVPDVAESDVTGNVASYKESAAASESAEHVRDQGDPDRNKASAAHMRLQGRKILLVDDDLRNIFALTGALESFGVEIVFAENGREGLAMLDRHADIDLILMDIMMPVMDGYEAIRTIRSGDAPYRDLPIVALTAKAMKHDAEKCIEAGANDYISKPVQYEQLFSIVSVWLHR